MLDSLEKFQTGIVGLIGFGGVIITLVVNARLTRRNLRETRDHDRDTLARGLLAELSSSRRAIDRNLRQLRGLDPATHPGLNMPAHNTTLVFDSSIARLGLLSNECIEPVLNAYLCLKEFDRSMVLFTRPEPSGLYRVLDTEKYAKAAVSMLESLLPPLDAAIKALANCSRRASS